MKFVDNFIVKIKDDFFSCEKGQIWKNNDTQEHCFILKGVYYGIRSSKRQRRSNLLWLYDF